jgi:hypothetical protein
MNRFRRRRKRRKWKMKVREVRKGDSKKEMVVELPVRPIRAVDLELYQKVYEQISDIL